MNFDDLFKELFQEFDQFLKGQMHQHSGFSCLKCEGPVAPLTGGICEACQFDEINMQLGEIVESTYGSSEAIRDDMAMMALGGAPTGYNPFHCLN
ncbi:MAG: hypothetical protein CL398_11655 [Acidiferrobacteraceae bacterium]|nr:hypothetical protein [Acidiferrobacteraceae bacterium]|tara:strand:+ start:306 stop:590 length:285 start_codon:yes stop_codon:yes gene_type:complete